MVASVATTLEFKPVESKVTVLPLGTDTKTVCPGGNVPLGFRLMVVVGVNTKTWSLSNVNVRLPLGLLTLMFVGPSR